jgi:hypothetical protein
LIDRSGQNVTKDNQHFVPQLYLRKFSITGHKSLLWEFDKELDCFGSKPRSVRQICKLSRYYEQVDAKGKVHPDLIERGYDRIVENKAAKLLGSINLKHNDDTVPLDPWDQACLAFFTASQYARVPDFRDKMEAIMRMRVEQEFNGLVAQQRSSGTIPLEIEALLAKARPEVNIEKWGTIRPMLNATSKVAEALLMKTPALFLPAPGMFFITSDNPVTYYIKDWQQENDPIKLEPVHPMAEVLFPLRKDLAVVYFPIYNPSWNQRIILHVRCISLDARLTRSLNVQTALCATRYLYMCEKKRTLFENKSE